MDYIEEQGKLFVGTNKSQIMTIDISHLLELNQWDDASPSLSSTVKKGGLSMNETGEKFNRLRDMHSSPGKRNHSESPDRLEGNAGSEL